jgi:GTP-binding protein LepA
LLFVIDTKASGKVLEICGGTMKQENVRNFCIIAHIDHGKSTLADRLLEETKVVDKNNHEGLILDDMDLEKERGITIKSHAIRMLHKYNGEEYTLNLIDTPGHVDFSYEVSRSLASCEGTLLLVDASQGIEAQTMSNMYLAMENDLEIVPVINKIDLLKADIEGTEHDIVENIGVDPEHIYKISARDGIGIDNLLEGIIKYIPAPIGSVEKPAKALIFDSYFDKYRGVIVLIRIIDGKIERGQQIKLMSTGKTYNVEEIGYLGLKKEKCEGLTTGEVGYIIPNIKEVSEAKVGDTITTAEGGCEEALPGFQEPKPMVYSGVFPLAKEDHENLRDALGKLKLNDAALTYEPESSLALGFGFRCGFLGMLHLEIVKERLFREFNVPIITTTPSVKFVIHMNNGSQNTIYNPVDMPDPAHIDFIEEPVMDTEIIVPTEYVGNIMKLVMDRRGIQKNMQYIDEKRVSISYEMPLVEIIFDFFDKMKSVSRGYASLDYHFKEYRKADVVKVDILINGDKVDAMSFICHESKASSWGRSITATLQDVIPKHLFKIALQASIGAKIIARSTITAMRKNVTAKCYGGDITRKKKLLEKQKEGKKRMKEIGSVSVPQEAFLEVLKADRD